MHNRARFYRKILVAPKIWKVCVPAQILYLGKLFLRYGPKCSQPIRFHDFLNNHISRINQWNRLLFCMLIQIHKLKVDLKMFWVGMVKNGCGQSGHRTLKLTVSQEWIDGLNWFFACWCKFKKLKVISMILGGRGQKWVWPFSSRDHKICFTLRMSLWIELVFLMLTVMQ